MKSMVLVAVMVALFLFCGNIYANEGIDPDTDMGFMNSAREAVMEQDDRMTDKMGGEARPSLKVGNRICPVSGNPIPMPGEKGDMGDAVEYEYGGKVYNLCCKMCVKDFKKDPGKYSKIAEDEAKGRME